MLYEKIDLYENFGIARGNNGGGYLTAYVPSRNIELREKIRPAVLIIPGGGYGVVSDREGEPVALRFVAAGYAVFLLQYTVKTAYPVPLIEAAMAAAYIRKHEREYFADPEHLSVIGFSAGGHLAGMLSTLYAEPCVREALKADAALVRPNAAILGYPVVTTKIYTHGGTANTISGGDPALRAALSLETRVSAESVPMFLWHTYEDELVPVENAILAADAYNKAGVPFELHIFECGRHGLSLANVETAEDESDVAYVENVQLWFTLALNWLKARGFRVRPRA